MSNTKYVGRKTKEGTWHVFKSGQTASVAGPFKSAEEARAWINSAKKEEVAEAAKWRSNLDAYDVDDEGNKTPKTANKFSYDPLGRRQDTAGDAKTARGKKSALKTSLKMAKGQHGPKGILPEQDVAEAGLKFHGGFPDVDHMRGSVIRNAEMATDNVKVKNKDEWESAVNSINSKVFDDESEFISSSKGTSVKANGVLWAKWNNDTQTGWFNAKGQGLKPHPFKENKSIIAKEAQNSKIAGRYDPEEWDAMVKRVGQRAKQGPLQTVYNKEKQLYKNVQSGQEVDTQGRSKDEWEKQVYAKYPLANITRGSDGSLRAVLPDGTKIKWTKSEQTVQEWNNTMKNTVNVLENTKSTADKKTDAKIAALEKKIKDTQDAIELARERRKMKGQRQQGPREITLGSKLDDLRQQLHMLTVNKKTAVNEDREYYAAERALADAKIAKENGDMGEYYTLMADYHDSMAQWNQSKGRYNAADRDAEKVKQYTNAAQKHNLYSNMNEDGLTSNPSDKVTLDVPLMIRIMEYAREDAKSDMDLHNVAEQLIKLSASGKTLSMQDYDSIVAQQTENKIFELGASNLPTAQTTKPTSPTTSTATQQTQGNTQPATTTTTSSTIKPAGTTTSPTVGVANPGATNLKPDEQEALNKIMTNAGLKTQFQQLVQKSKTVPGA